MTRVGTWCNPIYNIISFSIYIVIIRQASMVYTMTGALQSVVDKRQSFSIFFSFFFYSLKGIII